MQDAIQIIEEHLQKSNHAVKISQGSKKLDNGDAINKYDWTINHILKNHSNVEEFLKSLPKKGFTSGATLKLTTGNGSNFKSVGSIDLQFSEETISRTQTPNPTPTPQPVAHQPNPAHQNMNHQENPMAMMGYVTTTQQEIVDMKVKCARFDEMRDQLDRTRKERNKAEDECRAVTRKLEDAERKLSLINDKHEFEMLVAEKNRKSWFESDAGKQVLSEGMSALPQLAMALSKRGAGNEALTSGMGNPMEGMTEMQKVFASMINEYDDTTIELLSNVADAVKRDPNFFEYINQSLAQV